MAAASSATQPQSSEHDGVLANADEDTGTESFRPELIVERALRLKAHVKQRTHAVVRMHRQGEANVRRLQAEQRSHERARTAMAAGDVVRGKLGVEAAPAAGLESEADDRPAAESAATGPAADAQMAVAPASDAAGTEPSPGQGALERTDSGVSDRSSSRPSPRVRSEDGASKQRNRNMFGMLMGTLKRAREEVSASGQGAAQQQKLKMVDEKLRSDRARALEHAREETSTRLAAEVERVAALEVEREELEARLRSLNELSHQASLCQFLRTESAPPIYFLPSKHNEATRVRLREQQRSSLAPLEARLRELEALMPSGPAHEESSKQAGMSDAALDEPTGGAAETNGDVLDAEAPSAAAEDEERSLIANAMDDEMADEAVVTVLDEVAS